MSKKDILKDLNLDANSKEFIVGVSNKFIFGVVVVVIFLAIYVGNLLYGVNSFTMLLDLDNYYKYLQNKIELYKNDNAKLQKEYFELIELDADE